MICSNTLHVAIIKMSEISLKTGADPGGWAQQARPHPKIGKKYDFLA
jgi:hypothetical protein